MAQAGTEAANAEERFGDFVVTRRLAEDQGAIVFRARRHDAPSGEKSEQFVIVQLPGATANTPAGMTSFAAGDPSELGRDQRLDFLEVVKQQKKAHDSGARDIVPVLGYGLDERGAWYATEYYARGFLKKWISQRAGVSEAELRHIIRSLAESLLALKRQCQRSHGNLAGGSILIGGKPGMPLRDAPLMLTYLQPGEAKDALQFELADLRALGLIIFQLVCRRDIPAFNPDDYPIAQSEAWGQLGKSGSFWLGLCNRLLDPNLSLEKLSLETLVAELPTSEEAKPFPWWIPIAAAVVIVAGVGIYLALRPGKPAVATTSAEKSPMTTVANPPVTHLVENPPVVPVGANPSVPSNPPPITPEVVPPTKASPEISFAGLGIIGLGDQAVEQGAKVAKYPFKLGVSDAAATKLFVASASSKPEFLPDSSLKVEGDGNERVLIIDPVPASPGEVILAVSALGANTNVTRTFWFRVTASPVSH